MYIRMTNQEWSDDIDLTQEMGYSFIYKRLYELENDLVAGKMLKLPYAVGEKVYIACDWINKVVEGTVIEANVMVDCDQTYHRFYVDYKERIEKKQSRIIEHRYIFFPDELFNNKEDAEKRLKAIQWRDQ